MDPAKQKKEPSKMDKLVSLCKRRGFVTVLPETDNPAQEIEPRALKAFDLRAKQADQLQYQGPVQSLTTVSDFTAVLAPDAREPGTLSPPREFNLMFKTIVGALG